MKIFSFLMIVGIVIGMSGCKCGEPKGTAEVRKKYWEEQIDDEWYKRAAVLELDIGTVYYVGKKIDSNEAKPGKWQGDIVGQIVVKGFKSPLTKDTKMDMICHHFSFKNEKCSFKGSKPKIIFHGLNKKDAKVQD